MLTINIALIAHAGVVEQLYQKILQIFISVKEFVLQAHFLHFLGYILKIRAAQTGYSLESGIAPVSVI